MIYFNMGHNDIGYEDRTNQERSFTFTNKVQNTLILTALDWLGTGKQAPSSDAPDFGPNVLLLDPSMRAGPSQEAWRHGDVRGYGDPVITTRKAIVD